MTQSSTRPHSKFREYAEAILIAVLFLKFANTFVLQTFFIPSGSMEDTLLIGDHLFVNRFIYATEGPLTGASFLPSRTVQRGDIVIFRSVEDPSVDLVKRCVGLPGDELKMVAKQLYVNGQRVEDSSYALHKEAGAFAADPRTRAYVQKRDNFDSFVVPPDHYFCLGDNRDNSHDSRFWGPLPAENVRGRALLIYWSNGGETPDGKWRGIGNTLAHLAKTALGFFSNTRWERTLDLIR